MTMMIVVQTTPVGRLLCSLQDRWDNIKTKAQNVRLLIIPITSV